MLNVSNIMRVKQFNNEFEYFTNEFNFNTSADIMPEEIRGEKYVPVLLTTTWEICLC